MMRWEWNVVERKVNWTLTMTDSQKDAAHGCHIVLFQLKYSINHFFSAFTFCYSTQRVYQCRLKQHYTHNFLFSYFRNIVLELNCFLFLNVDHSLLHQFLYRLPKTKWTEHINKDSSTLRVQCEIFATFRDDSPNLHRHSLGNANYYSFRKHN